MPELLKLNFLPVRGLKKVRDLEYYEGPLLSEFHSETGAIYLYSWCDQLETGHRWMVFRVTLRDLTLYIHGRLSLHKLITEGEEGFVYFVDLDTHGDILDVYFVPIEEIPKDYIPSHDSFFMASTMPQGSGSNDVLLSDDWAFSDLGDFSHRYEDMYSFLYVLGTNRPSSTRLPDAKIDIRAGRGHASNQLFQRIINHVPRNERPRIGAFHMNSPGVLKIEANEDVASLIPKAIARFTARRKELESLYDRLYDARHAKKNPPGPELLTKWTVELIEKLGFVDVSRVQNATKSAEEFTDCILAYYRKIDKLVDYEIRNKAEIL